MGKVSRPQRPRKPRKRRWTSFVAPPTLAGGPVRRLEEQSAPHHRVRVEHDDLTLLIHLSDEVGAGWTTIAVDRPSRRVAVAQARRQVDSAEQAYEDLYRGNVDAQ